MGMNDKHDYDPTKWVDNSEPDIDAEHLNKIESALQEYGVSIDELAATGGTAAKVKATDTYGMVVEALGESTAQALIDAIANKVMNELINKNKIVNNLLATDASTVLAGTQGAALDKRLVAAENAVAQLNSDASKIVRVPVLIKTGTNILKLDAGIYDYEDSNASDQDKLSMGLPKAMWHSTIFVFGKHNSDGTGYINIFVIDCNADSSTIYHNFHKWTNWSGWNKISIGSI